MSIVFLCESRENVYNAYTEDLIGGNPIRTWNEFKENPIDGVEYVFSTWGMPSLNAQEIQTYFGSLKAVFYAAGTVQGFARHFLENGVRVFSAWAANAIPVAEFTVAQIILANKGYFKLHDLYKKHGYNHVNGYSENYSGNFGATVGLLGAGMIGKYVIKLLKAYKLNIKVFDPFMEEDAANDLGVEKCSLDEIFSTCDVISNHLANNEQTKEILGYSLFSKMKEYATFINTGRGGQLNSAEFLKAMGEKRNCTALLDVTDPTEPLPPNSEYFNYDNIFITPHRAGSHADEILRMGEFMFAEYDKVISNQKPEYEVDLEMLKTMA